MTVDTTLELAPDPDAPYGYKKDGTPAKRRGPRIPEDFQDVPAASTSPDDGEDVPPASHRIPPAKPAKPEKEKPKVPAYRKGMFVAPLTKFYERVGRIIKTFDKPTGSAVIDVAEDCAIAWDDLARTKPEVRALLLKLITPGAYAALVYAHLPILVAILMHDNIRKRLPFEKLLPALAKDEDTGVEGLLGNISQDDLAAMAQMMQNMPFNFNGSAPQPGGQT